MDFKPAYSRKYEEALSSVGELGFVVKVTHPISYVEGLPGASINEIVYFDNGNFGFVVSLSKDYVEILSLSNNPINVGSQVVRSGNFLSVNVGENLLGKSLDALGDLIYDNQLLTSTPETRLIDIQASGIASRERITETLETGISVIDLMIPLGKGQRELIIGDRKVGKTEAIFQMMLNQARKGTIIIYAGIGRQKTSIKKLEAFIDRTHIKDNVILVSSSASEALGLIYLTPYTAMTIAEYFRDRGKNTIVILDDLTTHAKYYREISLVSKKFPGREAYPGDVFYAHARLLERAGNFKTPHGATSITCFPIAETVEGDISGYIQTNLMSITDGHIYFDGEWFKRGQRPAINYFLSVTRVGRQTQSKLRWGINRELTSFLSLLDRTQNFVHFGTELNEGIKTTLSIGEKVTSFFNQPIKEVIPLNVQILVFCLIWSGFLSTKSGAEVQQFLLATLNLYLSDKSFETKVDSLITQNEEFNQLLGTLNTAGAEFISYVEKHYEKK